MHRIDSLTSGRANAVTGNDAAHAALDECSMAKTSEVDGDNVPCRHLGVLLSINTDAHSEADFDTLQYGVAIARRAGVLKEDVINTWSTKKLVDWLKKRG